MGYAKIADTATYDVPTGPDGQAFRITPPGGAFDTQPRIEGTVPQTAASVETPVPDGLIDIPGAFELYRSTSTLLGSCAPNVVLAARDGGAVLIPPYPPGTAARLTLVEGQTNVLEITASDLANLAEITYATPPTESTPLLVNVSGDFTGSMPNTRGDRQYPAPYILWNFTDATSVVVTGGDSLEGTIYAPRALVNWQVTQNIEGNVIAASFIHGLPAVTRPGEPREIHDWPFAASLSCVEDGPTPTPTPTPHADTDPDADTHVTPTPTPTPHRHRRPPRDRSGRARRPTPTDDLPATGGGDPGWLPLVAGLALVGGIALLIGDTVTRSRRRRT